VQHGCALSGEAVRQVLSRRSLVAGIKACPPTTCVAATPGTCSTPASTSQPSINSSAMPPCQDLPLRPPRRQARGAAAERLHLENEHEASTGAPVHRGPSATAQDGQAAGTVDP